MQWVIVMLEVVPLAKHHDRVEFDCGNIELNQYLNQYANQHAKKGIAKTYVLINTNAPNVILGFYCMGAYTLDNSTRVLTGFPNEVPACLIGRLAIDKSMQGKSLANYLFAHAFLNIGKISTIMGLAFVVVDVKHDGLVPFYQKMGFEKLTPNGKRMVLSAKALNVNC